MLEPALSRVGEYPSYISDEEFAENSDSSEESDKPKK